MTARSVEQDVQRRSGRERLEYRGEEVVEGVSAPVDAVGAVGPGVDRERRAEPAAAVGREEVRRSLHAAYATFLPVGTHRGVAGFAVERPDAETRREVGRDGRVTEVVARFEDG